MDYWHKAYECPYWKWGTKLELKCECGKLAFPDRKAALDYMNRFCADKNNGWKKCSIADMTNDYYERDGANEQSRKKSNEKKAAGT